MSFIFFGCNPLININLTNLNNQNAIYMSFIFYGCYELKIIIYLISIIINLLKWVIYPRY